MRAILVAITTALSLLTSSVTAAEVNFDPDKVPFIDAKKKELLAGYFAKAESKAAFTLAVSTDGKYDGAWWGTSIAPSDRVRMSLQACEQRAKAPCVLVTRDGVMTGETTPKGPSITYSTDFALSNVPFISEETRQWLSGYFRAKEHKAIAMRGTGAVFVSSGKDSEEEAIASALSGCAERNKTRCFLYAAGDKVVFNKSTDIFPK